MIAFLSALGLVLVIEGSLYALFPDAMKRTMAYTLTLPAQTLRAVGLVLAIFGFLIVGVLRGF